MRSIADLESAYRAGHTLTSDELRALLAQRDYLIRQLNEYLTQLPQMIVARRVELLANRWPLR